MMKELKFFLAKIMPTLLLTKAPLVSARDLIGDVETHGFNVSKMFLPKCQYFLHQALCLPTFVPFITFLV